MVCSGFEPGVAGWQAQRDPLSYGGTPVIPSFFLMLNVKNDPANLWRQDSISRPLRQEFSPINTRQTRALSLQSFILSSSCARLKIDFVSKFWSLLLRSITSSSSFVVVVAVRRRNKKTFLVRIYISSSSSVDFDVVVVVALIYFRSYTDWKIGPSGMCYSLRLVYF